MVYQHNRGLVAMDWLTTCPDLGVLYEVFADAWPVKGHPVLVGAKVHSLNLARVKPALPLSVRVQTS